MRTDSKFLKISQKTKETFQQIYHLSSHMIKNLETTLLSCGYQFLIEVFTIPGMNNCTWPKTGRKVYDLKVLTAICSPELKTTAVSHLCSAADSHRSIVLKRLSFLLPNKHLDQSAWQKVLIRQCFHHWGKAIETTRSRCSTKKRFIILWTPQIVSDVLYKDCLIC